MTASAKTAVTIPVSLVLGAVVPLVITVAAGEPISAGVVALLGAGFGLLYGLEAGLLASYDLATANGWGQLIVDMTWSLPNTVFGFAFGNLIYVLFGNPSKSVSKNAGFIAFMPRGTSAFGNRVLQTLGTVNLGGPGQHELMHVFQARLFGPLYLPIFALNYVINFAVQFLWTITVGGILRLSNVRDTAYFTPPSESVVSGFFGWIYHSTLFELWAYSSGNP